LGFYPGGDVSRKDRQDLTGEILSFKVQYYQDHHRSYLQSTTVTRQVLTFEF